MFSKWLASLVSGMLFELFNRFLSWLKAQKTQADKNKSIDKETAGQADKLKKSVTDEQDEQAARDILNRDS